MEKFCNSCNISKNLKEFGKDNKNQDGYLYTCKCCRAIVRKKNIQKDPNFYKKEYKRVKYYFKIYFQKPEQKRKTRNRRLKRDFNITIEEYEKMVIEHDNLCSICKQPETSKKNKNLCVDHCHKTGKIRGLLCNNCNRCLGLLNDNVDILRNALFYLEKNK